MAADLEGQLFRGLVPECQESRDLKLKLVTNDCACGLGEGHPARRSSEEAVRCGKNY